MAEFRIALFIALCLAFASPAGADVDTQEMPTDLRLAIEENTELVIQSLSEIAGFTLGMEQKSVEWIDGFARRSRDEGPGSLIDTLGCFFGDADIARYGGEWVLDDGEPEVAIQGDFVVFPFSKCCETV